MASLVGSRHGARNPIGCVELATDRSVRLRVASPIPQDRAASADRLAECCARQLRRAAGRRHELLVDRSRLASARTRPLPGRVRKPQVAGSSPVVGSTSSDLRVSALTAAASRSRRASVCPLSGLPEPFYKPAWLLAVRLRAEDGLRVANDQRHDPPRAARRLDRRPRRIFGTCLAHGAGRRIRLGCVLGGPPSRGGGFGAPHRERRPYANDRLRAARRRPGADRTARWPGGPAGANEGRRPGLGRAGRRRGSGAGRDGVQRRRPRLAQPLAPSTRPLDTLARYAALSRCGPPRPWPWTPPLPA